MKARIALFLILAAASIACSHDPITLKVITLNIRYDNPSDGINAWPARKETVVDFLRREEAGLIGLQEALWHQYAFIDSSLQGWGSVAAGRDDGLKAGEMAPIFYRLELFDIVESGTFWLSETPGIPGSRGWGAVLPRIVTWACLKQKEDGDTIFYFNTHFSHMSDSARIMSSKILRSEVSKIAGNRNFIITGDFNMVPGSRAYEELVQPPVVDSYTAPGVYPLGETYTFNGFNDTPGDGRIDYIFVCEGFEVLTHNTLAVMIDSVYISDHWPVIVSLKTPGK